MRKTVMLCMTSILAGCVQPNGQSTDPVTESEFVYDERDVIATDIPLPKQGVNQRPVVGEKKILVSVINWKDEAILNPDVTFTNTLSTDPTSLRTYILAASGGKLTLSGQVISHTAERVRPEECKSGTSSYPMALAKEMGVEAAKKNNVNPEDFDYIFNVISCRGAANANLGGRYMGVYGQGSPHVYRHEFGHNLGYDHGSTYTKCPKNGDTVTAPNGCSTTFLGDTGDTVSGGGTLYPAFNRWYSGWLNPKQVATIKSTGLYRLGVLGGSGPQLYLVEQPSDGARTQNYLSLEYRKPTNFDNFPATDNRVMGVWARFSTVVYYNSKIINYQLDATPETATTTDPTLISHKIFADNTNGTTIKTCTVSDHGATVAIAFQNEPMPSCNPGLLPAPTIELPVVGAPPQPKPVVVSGKSLPGALIIVRLAGAESLASTSADTTGAWKTTLPASMTPASYRLLINQSIGLGFSSDGVREITIAP